MRIPRPMKNTGCGIAAQPIKWPRPPSMTMTKDIGNRILPSRLNGTGTNPD